MNEIGIVSAFSTLLFSIFYVSRLYQELGILTPIIIIFALLYATLYFGEKLAKKYSK